MTLEEEIQWGILRTMEHSLSEETPKHRKQVVWQHTKKLLPFEEEEENKDRANKGRGSFDNYPSGEQLCFQEFGKFKTEHQK